MSVDGSEQRGDALAGRSGFSDPLHRGSPPEVCWTTVNAEEALPGVLTPLGWTFWEEAIERGVRRGWSDIGALSRREAHHRPTVDNLESPDPFALRSTTVLFGHYVANVTFLRAVADRLPGTSGDAIEQQLFGGVTPGASSSPTRRRYLPIAVRMPGVAVALPRRVARLREEQHRWWQGATAVSALTAESVGQKLTEAMGRLEWALRDQAVARLLSQGVYEQVCKLAEHAGRPGLELRLTTGYGTLEESRIAADLWEVSRGRRSLEDFVLRHGYHGRNEGEISGCSWREDDGPLRSLVERYAGMGEDEEPARVAKRQLADRQNAEAELFSCLSDLKRRRAAWILRMARRYVPLTEITKGTFLQAVDAGRAAARTAGIDLARRGVLSDPEDVFYLTVEELLAGPPADASELVDFRRARRAEYLSLALPERFVGEPEKLAVAVAEPRDLLTGLGASTGTVEGRARVIRDADEMDTMEHGEILVCETTDPSWAIAFVLASALVIDVGGPLSHGAIIAREMGVPCVINTRVGTQVIHTGDSIRVDGSAGRVTVLKREPEPTRETSR